VHNFRLDRWPLLEEAQHDATTDALGATRNNCDFSFQPPHRFFSRQRLRYGGNRPLPIYSRIGYIFTHVKHFVDRIGSVTVSVPDEFYSPVPMKKTATLPLTPVPSVANKNSLSPREIMKRETRWRLEDAAIKMIREHGFHAMTIEQIAKAAGSTRPTFYQYFKDKADLIHFIQERHIAPEMIAILQRLDALVGADWQYFRAWVSEYAATWKRIHIFFDAYSEASQLDPAIARTIVPNTAQVTAHMTQLLGRFQGEEQRRVMGKIDLLLTMLASVMGRVYALDENPDKSPHLDYATDILWDAIFAALRRN
jgi:AcrR family transcriptional regulator